MTITTLDTQELIAKRDELDAEIEDHDDGTTVMTADELFEVQEERDNIEALLDEIGDEARYGVTLIREDGFEEYTQDLANDLGLFTGEMTWPFTCIDWERAANELRQDYSEIEYDGDTWVYRA